MGENKLFNLIKKDLLSILKRSGQRERERGTPEVKTPSGAGCRRDLPGLKPQGISKQSLLILAARDCMILPPGENINFRATRSCELSHSLVEMKLPGTLLGIVIGDDGSKKTRRPRNIDIG